jgi:hypothetical protein
MSVLSFAKPPSAIARIAGANHGACVKPFFCANVDTCSSKGAAIGATSRCQRSTSFGPPPSIAST